MTAQVCLVFLCRPWPGRHLTQESLRGSHNTLATSSIRLLNTIIRGTAGV